MGTQPGARERAPNEPPHPSQGRSQCTLLSLPRPLQRRSYLYPRPRDSGLQLLGSRSLSPTPWDPRVPPSCISWSPSPGPSRLPLRVHILSLINVHSVFPPPFCLCVVVCGHQRTGREIEVAVLSPPPPPPFSASSSHILPSTPHTRVSSSLDPCPHLRPSDLRVEATAFSPPPSNPSPAPTPACGAWKPERK